MEYKLLIDKHTLEQNDYDYVEHLEGDFYEFNDVKIDKDMIANHIKNHGFVWFDDFDLSWFMTVVSIAKNIHTNRFNILAVKD